MNEADARQALLVRAYETTAAGRELWNDADRVWASRAAAAVVGESAPLDSFIARRAQLALERLATRDRAVPRALRAFRWRPWVAPLLIALAFAAGLVIDSIGPKQRINILAPPLLALMLWSLAVYLLIAARAVAGFWVPALSHPGPLVRALGRLARAMPVVSAHADAAPSAAFMQQWLHASRTLIAARVGRMLHVAAILFALGALGGLYMRGLALEYRAGWESTFLSADTVHTLLTFVLGPAAALTGVALPDAAHIATLRFPDSHGESAAPWIHLYAAMVALVVLLPRALLALLDHWRERRTATHFPLALDDPYFIQLARQHRAEPALAAVVPYGHTPSAQAALGLSALIVRVFGAAARVEIMPSIPFGGEDAPALALPAAPLTLAAALFVTTATPEAEHHGGFVSALAAALPRGVPLVAIADEAAFRARFGHDARRIDERRTAWRQMLAAHRCEVVFADLEHPELAHAEQTLQAALDRTNTPAVFQNRR